MKKAIAIIILGLLLGGCISHEKLMKQTTFYKGMTKSQITYIFRRSRTDDTPFFSCLNEYYQKNKTEILVGASKKLYLVFENVTRPRASC